MVESTNSTHIAPATQKRAVGWRVLVYVPVLLLIVTGIFASVSLVLQAPVASDVRVWGYDLGASVPHMAFVALSSFIGLVLLAAALSQPRKRDDARADIQPAGTSGKRLLDDFIEITKQGLWECNFPAGTIDYNDSLYEMLGCAPGSIGSDLQSWAKMLHPDDADEALRMFERHCQGELESYQVEYRVRTREGAYIWVRQICNISSSAQDGTPIRSISVLTDIDAAKRHQLVLRDVASVDPSTTGVAALNELARCVAKSYDASHVWIATVTEHGKANLLAGWEEDGPVKAITYSLSGTPCGKAMASRFCHIKSEVANSFPGNMKLIEMGVSGFCGLRLSGCDGNQIGLISIFSRHPLEYTSELESTIRVVGARASSEIERASIEDTLHAAQDRLTLAIHAAKLGFLDWNPVTNEIYFSKELCEMIGFPAHAVEESVEWWLSRIHPNDQDSVRSRITDSSMRFIDSIDREFRVRLASGEWHWFNDTSEVIDRNPDGSPARVICVLADKHQERANKHELASARQLLEEAGRMAQVGGWEFNVATQELRWTDETYRIHEMEIGASVDVTTAIDYYTGDSRRKIHECFEACLNDGTPWDKEFTMRTARGKDICVRTIGTADIRDGQIERIYGTFQDITALRATLQKLREAKNEAESASHAKSMFLANMSHEIRTPLTAILGNAELMKNDPDYMSSPALRTDAVEAVQRNADHLLAIINDVLDSSKIDAGMMKLETITMNPSNVIEEAIAMLLPRVNSDDVEISAVYLTEMPRTILSDPTRVRQILINLIGNAIKFTQKGTIRIEAAYNALPDMAGMLILRVIDTGIGIPEDSLDSLMRFEAFNQADGSMTRRYGGTGLGLRITNSLISLFGGSLNITSEPGVGTNVTASIRVQPVAEPEMWLPPEIHQSEVSQNKQNGADEQTSPSLENISILLVEDGEDNRKLITYMLKRAGAHVTTAVNGMEAVRIHERTATTGGKDPFDIILMDMQMPELDGYSATSRLRENGYTGPIIALTAHAMAGDRERCIEAGCQEYLTKPIKSATLINACSRLLGFDCGYARAG